MKKGFTDFVKSTQISAGGEKMIYHIATSNNGFTLGSTEYCAPVTARPLITTSDPTDRVNNKLEYTTVAPFAGTLKSLICSGKLPTGGNAITLSINVNGSPSGISVTLNAGSDDGFGNAIGSDLMNTLSISRFDRICIKSDNTANATAWLGNIQFVLDPI